MTGRLDGVEELVCPGDPHSFTGGSFALLHSWQGEGPDEMTVRGDKRVDRQTVCRKDSWYRTTADNCGDVRKGIRS